MATKSINRFTELTDRVFMNLKTIEMIGPSMESIGPLGERGVDILRYLERRLKRVKD